MGDEWSHGSLSDADFGEVPRAVGDEFELTRANRSENAPS
jgi:hypothetical protein